MNATIPPIRTAPEAMKHPNPLYLAVILSLIGACKSTTVIDQRREAPTSINQNEAVVILGRRHNTAYETETDFVSCVGQSL